MTSKPNTPKNDDTPKPGVTPAQRPEKPKEIGGRDGLDPVRYGDWEVGGKCVDF